MERHGIERVRRSADRRLGVHRFAPSSTRCTARDSCSSTTPGRTRTGKPRARLEADPSYRRVGKPLDTERLRGFRACWLPAPARRPALAPRRRTRIRGGAIRVGRVRARRRPRRSGHRLLAARAQRRRLRSVRDRRRLLAIVSTLSDAGLTAVGVRELSLRATAAERGVLAGPRGTAARAGVGGDRGGRGFRFVGYDSVMVAGVLLGGLGVLLVNTQATTMAPLSVGLCRRITPMAVLRARDTGCDRGAGSRRRVAAAVFRRSDPRWGCCAGADAAVARLFGRGLRRGSTARGAGRCCGPRRPSGSRSR